ncbi:nitrous oxide-stimulated promoter family protein [Pontiellaceae bacterium B1224]|nr:nitrous oxide-stimulated promoter family protein [Pontiellaceae bacterium B1224]
MIIYSEFRTIEIMIRLYCRKRHGSRKALCADCARLLAYAAERIEKCPFGADKPVCNQCTVHCYKPEMRERVKEVMRYSGPRMLLRHPVLAIRHLIRSGVYSGKRSK